MAPLILKGRELSASTNSASATCNSPELGGWADREALSDLQILNFALVLEYLEATFYLRADNRGSLPGGATLLDIDPDGGESPGQVGNIDDTGILAAAGSIAGVEGEHAAGFRLINGAPITPDNNAFDMRRDSSEVIDLARGFITKPDPLPAPMNFPGG